MCGKFPTTGQGFGPGGSGREELRVKNFIKRCTRITAATVAKATMNGDMVSFGRDEMKL